ncbi:MAG: hypothetical protein IJA06_06605 [Oscillospiraceae bacterium]|nr:hypothetical protein [Oscillospiraceae bacterium]
MKKILAMLLAAVMMLAIGVTAFAAEVPTITVSEVSGTAAPGDEITVTVSIKNNPGFFAITLPIEYDAEKLEKVSFEGKGDLTWTIETQALGENKVMANYTGNGEILVLKFKVKDNAASGDAVVTIGKVKAATFEGGKADFTVVSGGVTVKAPCKHADTTTINAKEGTCKEAGYSGDTYCNECKTTIAYGKATAKDAKNHVGGTEVKNVKAGTCAEAGYTGDTCCKGCGEVIAEGKATAKDPANHTGKTELDKASAVEPDCKNSGKEANTICSGCKAVLKEGKEIPATGKHGGGVATCTAKAVCTGCGTEYGELDPKNHGNHETEVKNAKEADCTEAGYTGDIYCKGCKNKIETGKVIDALGHKGGEATCQAKAVCEVCKEEYGELGEHKGGEATCTAKAVCEVCQEEYGELAEHKFGNWVVEKEATYTEEGLAKRECENCDEVEEKEIAKKRRPSDDKGLVVDLTGKDEGEANPNTGAVITLSSTVGVIGAVAAVAIFRKRK